MPTASPLAISWKPASSASSVTRISSTCMTSELLRRSMGAPGFRITARLNSLRHLPQRGEVELPSASEVIRVGGILQDTPHPKSLRFAPGFRPPRVGGGDGKIVFDAGRNVSVRLSASCLLRRDRHRDAGHFELHGTERRMRGEVERFPVIAAKGDVRRLRLAVHDAAELPALGIDDVDAARSARI